MSCLSRLNWRGPGPVFSIAVLEIEIKHRSDDPDAKWWGWESEKTLRPEESQAPLPDSTATQPHCEWGKPRGLPLPLLPKKCPYIWRLLFRAPPAAVWWGALQHGSGDGWWRQNVLMGTGGRWGDRGEAWGTGTWRRTEHIDLQMPELIACCLQLGFIAQLLINCFRI